MTRFRTGGHLSLLAPARILAQVQLVRLAG